MSETFKANFGRKFLYGIANDNPENLSDQDWIELDANEDALAWFEEQKSSHSPDSSLYIKEKNGNIRKLK